jgi:hypothetical protein
MRTELADHQPGAFREQREASRHCVEFAPVQIRNTESVKFGLSVVQFSPCAPGIPSGLICCNAQRLSELRENSCFVVIAPLFATVHLSRIKPNQGESRLIKPIFHTRTKKSPLSHPSLHQRQSNPNQPNRHVTFRSPTL